MESQYFNPNRRTFLKSLGAGALLLAAQPFRATATALQAEADKDIFLQLQLIGDIRSYLGSALEMNLGENFYTKWEEREGMLYYLYISEPDQVKVPLGMQEFLYFGSDFAKAQAAENYHRNNGFHTLLYKTAGTSATLLNDTLLSYPMEAIAVIAAHEAMHVHIRQHQKHIPILVEEAAADVLANRVIEQYLDFTNLLNSYAVSKLVRVNEKIYKTINQSLTILETYRKPQEWVYLKCQQRLTKLLHKSNLYQQDRFDYPINNAFMLRNSYYSKYYFLLNQLYSVLKQPVAFTNFVMSLPDNEEQALENIRLRIFYPKLASTLLQ